MPLSILERGFIFLFQHLPFLLHHLTISLPMEASYAAIRGDDPMTGDIRSKGIALEGLPYSLSGTASYALSQLLIGYGLAPGHFQQRKIHLTLELCYVLGVKD